MDSDRRKQLEAIMARLPDDGAAVQLYLEFGTEIRAALVAIGRNIGLRRFSDDDLDAVAFDACLEIGRIGGAWRPDGGALPWSWAKARLATILHAHAGPSWVPFDEHTHDTVAIDAPNAGADPEPATVLAALADNDERCALVLDALRSALSDRDVAILLRHASSSLDDRRAPSHQVAAEVGMAAPAVRKVASRARRKLRQVVDDNPRYASLAGIALLADADSNALSPRRQVA